jgi:hypothetical protein
VAGGYLYPLAVGSHALSDLELAGLALPSTGRELFFGPLHSQLVLVGQVAMIGHTRSLGSILGVVALIRAALLGRGGALQAVVGIDLVLELGGDLLVVVEGRAVLDRLLILRDLDDLTLVVGPPIWNGIRVLLVPRKPIFTPMYSGWSLSSTKKSSTLPIFS